MEFNHLKNEVNDLKTRNKSFQLKLDNLELSRTKDNLEQSRTKMDDEDEDEIPSLTEYDYKEFLGILREKNMFTAITSGWAVFLGIRVLTQKLCAEERSTVQSFLNKALYEKISNERGNDWINEQLKLYQKKGDDLIKDEKHK